MYNYKWIDLESNTFHAFIDNEEGSILTLTKEQFNNCNFPDKTKEINFI
jgi:hypothetical protein